MSRSRCLPAVEDEARAFYGGLLGFREIAKPTNLAGRGGCWFETGNLQVHLGVDTAFVPATKAHIAYEVDDLDAMRERFAGLGSRLSRMSRCRGIVGSTLPTPSATASRSCRRTRRRGRLFPIPKSPPSFRGERLCRSSSSAAHRSSRLATSRSVDRSAEDRVEGHVWSPERNLPGSRCASLGMRREEPLASSDASSARTACERVSLGRDDGSLAWRRKYAVPSYRPPVDRVDNPSG